MQNIAQPSLPIEEIDCLTASIRLRWQCTSGQLGYLTTAVSCGLIIIESIRGVVSLVGNDFVLSILDETHLWKSRALALDKKKTGWSTELFYVTRIFKVNNTDLFNIVALGWKLQNPGFSHSSVLLYALIDVSDTA